MLCVSRVALVVSLTLLGPITGVAQDKATAGSQRESREERGRRAFEEASAKLASKDPADRVAAADAMGRRGYRLRHEIAPLLIKALADDPDPRVRAAAGRAIGRLGTREAVPQLVRSLRDKSADVRVVAAAALWRLPDPAAVPALLERLKDEDPSVREWSATALGVIGDRRAVKALIRLLGDDVRAVRLSAVRSMGRIQAPSAVKALKKFLSAERDTEEHQEGVNALANLEGSGKVNALVSLLASTDEPQHKIRLLMALGQVGDALVIPRLRAHLESGPDPVRAAAKEAVSMVEQRLEDSRKGRR